MQSNPQIADRIQGRLDRLELSPEDVDRKAGLPPGTVLALINGGGRLPRGDALRRFAAALDVDEEFVIGLEPGDLIPVEMLQDPQGDLGLLAPDEEALLKNYRRLDVPTRAAIIHLVARAAGPEPEPAAEARNRPSRPRRGRQMGIQNE